MSMRGPLKQMVLKMWLHWGNFLERAGKGSSLCLLDNPSEIWGWIAGRCPNCCLRVYQNCWGICLCWGWACKDSSVEIIPWILLCGELSCWNNSMEITLWGYFHEIGSVRMILWRFAGYRTCWGFMDNLNIIPTPRVLNKCYSCLFSCIFLVNINHIQMHMFIQSNHWTFTQTKQRK